MPLTANISLVVPALPENDIAFANSAAWQNYWKNIAIQANFNGAANAQYVESAYDNSLLQVDFNWNGIDFSVPSISQFNSLLLAYQVLNTNYKNLRQAMKDASFITQAQ